MMEVAAVADAVDGGDVVLVDDVEVAEARG